jgi:hypothetical protein
MGTNTVRLILICAVLISLSGLRAEAAKNDITLFGSVGQKYDDNITYAEDDELGDFITALSTGVTVNYANPQTFLEAQARIVQQYYWDYSENNHNAQYLSLKGEHALSKNDRIMVSNDFSHSYEPYGFEEQFNRVGGLYDSFRNRFHIDYQRDVTKYMRVKVAYENSVDLTDRADLLDSYINKVLMEGIYSLNSKTHLFAGYEFMNHELDDMADATIHSLNGGIKYYFTEQLSLEARSGVDLIESFNGNHLTEPMWTLTLTDQITKTEAIHLSFSKRYSTNPYTDDVLDSWRVSTTLEGQLRKRLTGALEIFYGQGEYAVSDIDEQFLGGNIKFLYQLTRNLQANFSYTNSRTTSNLHSREYSKNVVFLGLTASF